MQHIKKTMPKRIRTSQMSRKRTQVVTCDADNMKMSIFHKIVQTHGSKSDETEAVETVYVHTEYGIDKSHEIPVPEQSTIGRNNISLRNLSKRGQFCKDFSSPTEQCTDGCRPPNITLDEERDHNEPNDMYPPPMHWKTMLDEIQTRTN